MIFLSLFIYVYIIILFWYLLDFSGNFSSFPHHFGLPYKTFLLLFIYISHILFSPLLLTYRPNIFLIFLTSLLFLSFWSHPNQSNFMSIKFSKNFEPKIFNWNQHDLIKSENISTISIKNESVGSTIFYRFVNISWLSPA